MEAVCEEVMVSYFNSGSQAVYLFVSVCPFAHTHIPGRLLCNAVFLLFTSQSPQQNIKLLSFQSCKILSRNILTPLPIHPRCNLPVWEPLHLKVKAGDVLCFWLLSTTPFTSSIPFLVTSPCVLEARKRHEERGVEGTGI